MLDVRTDFETLDEACVKRLAAVLEQFPGSEQVRLHVDGPELHPALDEMMPGRVMLLS
jgi:hypothetical protein